MAVDPARAKSLFLAASDLPSASDRAAFLDRECGGDAQLRARVEALLAVEDRAGSPGDVEATSLIEPTRGGETVAAIRAGEIDGRAGMDAGDRAETIVDGQGTTLDGTTRPSSAPGPPSFVPGRVIAGRYTLRAVLGEGGMGTVYRADQTEPVRRQVALKLIRVGMDSRAVLARFDAERQALAMMDHPNIARVYDGGTTETGQPFFVMELVEGVPITDYCDRHRLPVKARLDLFVAACRAVQHAHQKGIIHRDLKPSNVLVAEVDERPTPKVIDFGVAKAVEFDLTDQSLGDTGAIVGTSTYMSPEQADPASMDIDNRTDVYALGVILYELLAGSPPLDASRFKRGALLEMLRMVREVDPPKPSTKVGMADTLPTIAAERGIEPSQLKRALSGDLDWIVMKALEKDRSRRYETANGFAADILRHLASEPVRAAPPSRAYRLRKFVRKHRGAVFAASLVLLALLAGMAGTTWGLYRAEVANAELADKNRDLAEEKRKVEERERLAIGAVGKFRDAVMGNPELQNNPALAPLRRALLKEPLSFFQELRDRLQADGSTRPESLDQLSGVGIQLGELHYEMGDKSDAARTLGEAIPILERLAREHPEMAGFPLNQVRALTGLGNALRDTGDLAGSRRAIEQALPIMEGIARAHPDEHDYHGRLAGLKLNLGTTRLHAGDEAGARKDFEEAAEIQERLVREHPEIADHSRSLATTRNNLAALLMNSGDLAGAIRQTTRAIEILDHLFHEHASVHEYSGDLAKSRGNLGVLLDQAGDRSAAKQEFDRSLQSLERLVREHPAVTDYAFSLDRTRYHLAMLAAQSGDLPGARSQLELARDDLDRQIGLNPDFPQLAELFSGVLASLGDLLAKLHDLPAAREEFARARRIGERLVRAHPDSPDLTSGLGATLHNFAGVEIEAGRFAEARDLLHEAIAWQKKALAIYPSHPIYLQFLRNHYTALKLVADRLGDRALAAEAAAGLGQPPADERLDGDSKGDEPRDKTGSSGPGSTP